MNKSAPIENDGSFAQANRHACAFFNNDDEAYRALLPFIAEGFECGHKAVHIVAPEKEARHLERLAESGIDPSAACATGQLDIRRNTDTYLANGRFDQELMLASFEAMATENRGRGFPLSRIVCDMDWGPGQGPRPDEVIEFEAKINAVWRRNPDIVICAYSLRTLTGDMVIDIMRTHPMVLIGNALQENPFFVPPEEFLEERRKRHAERRG